MRLNHGRTRATVSAGAIAALALAGCGTASTNADRTSGPTPSSPSAATSTIQPGPTSPTTTPSPTTRPSASSTDRADLPELPDPTRARADVEQSPTTEPSPSASTSTSTRGSDDTTRDDAKRGDAKPTQPPSSGGSVPAGEPIGMGDSGARVLAAQQKLLALGYGVGTADGAYGSGTRQGVWALQKVAGLPRTGKIDAATLAALKRGVRGNPSISNGLEIDLGKQVMYVVRGGSLVRTLNISSGNGERFKYPVAKDKKTGKVTKWATATANTSRGTFAIYMERNENWKSTLELGSMYRPKYFDGAIAIHGSGSVPPQPASHGCVRVSNQAMDWLWSSGYASKGTTVVSR